MDLSRLSCESLTGIGKRNAEKLARLGIYCVQDLLFHLPLRYQDRTEITKSSRLTVGDHAVVEGVIQMVDTPVKGKTKLLCTLRDEGGYFYLRFLYTHALQKKLLQPGVRLRCFGEIRLGSHGLEMIHPEYIIIYPNKPLPVDETLTPIYPATEGISQLFLRKITDQALQLLKNNQGLRDIIPAEVLNEFSFPDLVESLSYVHRPPKQAPIDLLLSRTHATQKRLVFEELLAHRLSLLRLKNTFQAHAAKSFNISHELKNIFLLGLPFSLTNAQQRVIHEIEMDLSRPFPMLRLVQGDVGSGKTVVAACALLQAIANGAQAVLLAPTELLAEQHGVTLRRWFASMNIPVYLLSGQIKTAERNTTLKAMTENKPVIVVGTHAIFQKHISFANLGLIIVDEQHRFGVHQRALLREKGIQGNDYPHQLVMTATPIPRTLAMSAYADLDYSVIDELPPGRTAISTIVISNDRRDDVLARIRVNVQAGKQIYWVCTLIEESELLQCQAAEKTAAYLQQQLNMTIGLIHGRMNSAEKEAIMQAFKRGDISLLVATTVIEVGVDVPNASLMIIENAERLGLAQLHQLRGRVGRGSVASHCVLLYQAPLSMFAKERLQVMRETTDGFKIAQRDLELRGPGEVLGTKQTGNVSLRIADLVRDSDLLPAVQKAAHIIETKYPELLELLMQRWLGQKQDYGRV